MKSTDSLREEVEKKAFDILLEVMRLVKRNKGADEVLAYVKEALGIDDRDPEKSMTNRGLISLSIEIMIRKLEKEEDIYDKVLAGRVLALLKRILEKGSF